MTVFIATLFLPYTVSFEDPNHSIDRDRVKEPESKGNAEPTCYFSLPSTSIARANPSSIPLTPGATIDAERIFVAENVDELSKMRLKTSHSVSSLRSLIRPELQSPSWGKNISGKQPRSRAKSPPPASVLKHAVAIEPSIPDRSVISRRKGKRILSDPRFSQSDFSVDLGVLGNGGLFSALDAATECGILQDKTWVGTLGMPTDAISDHVKSSISERLENDFESLAVFVSDNDMNGHYEHYCKTMLWPVLHYQIPDHPKSKAYEDHSWVFYVYVNQAFANCIIKNWKRGDVVWVHDYHLLLVPGMLRKQLPDAQIGFYLHSAFPSSEIFRCLAMRSELLDGILGANMIGFQTEEYVHHFMQTCSRLLNVEASKHGIMMEDGRLVHVGRFPMGVDPATVENRRQHQDVKKWIGVISERYAGKKLIISRDKLDGVRGIKQKMLAYEAFLQKHPEHRSEVVLIQIATSTTEDLDLSFAITEIAARINSTYSTLAHQPLVFLKQDITYSQWLGLSMVSDGLLVTSLREGMNLTSQEYVYCQDGKYGSNKHSPLILSECTGTATLLQDSALLVNPWNYRQCAEAMEKALEMSNTEKESRWQKMYDVLMENNAINWFKSYIEALGQAFKDNTVRDATSVPRLSFPSLSKQYANASSRLLILDYEGTLAAWGSPSDTILTTPKRSMDVLNDLIEDKNNIVYVMSSRRPDEMGQLFKLVPGLGMIAENGAYILEAGSNEWLSFVDAEHVKDWKLGVQDILRYYEERVERSKIEELDSAMIFSYAASCDKQTAFKQAGECANHINEACQRQKVQALPIEDGIYISDANINKSSATQVIGNRLLHLSTHESALLPDFLLVIGDSREDEYVFDWAHKMSDQGIRDVITVNVGQRNTTASYTLTQGVAGVVSVLQKLANLPTPDRREFSANGVGSRRAE